jgi:hypothetical protein
MPVLANCGPGGGDRVEMLPHARDGVDDEPNARADAEGLAQPRQRPHPLPLRKPPEKQEVRRQEGPHEEDRADIRARVRRPDEAHEREDGQQPRQREVRRQDPAQGHEPFAFSGRGFPRRGIVQGVCHARLLLLRSESPFSSAPPFDGEAGLDPVLLAALVI